MISKTVDVTIPWCVLIWARGAARWSMVGYNRTMRLPSSFAREKSD